jgi:hypothetical protein
MAPKTKGWEPGDSGDEVAASLSDMIHSVGSSGEGAFCRMKGKDRRGTIAEQTLYSCARAVYAAAP